MTNSVLVISTKVDAGTDDVATKLRQVGVPLYRLNTEDYPFSKTITYEPGSEPALWCGFRAMKIIIPS